MVRNDAAGEDWEYSVVGGWQNYYESSACFPLCNRYIYRIQPLTPYQEALYREEAENLFEPIRTHFRVVTDGPINH